MKGKVALLIVLTLLLGALAAVAVFWDPILDALPIDQSGWEKVDDTYYYLDEDGDPVTGWMELDGKRYYFGPGGMVTGWLKLSDGTYYLSQGGNMQTGWQMVDHQRHYLDENGKLHSGWLEQSEGSYYLDENGTPTLGWLSLDGKTYYLDEQGLVVCGWQEIEDQMWLFDENGVLRTDCWVQRDGNQYHLGTDGREQTGWLELGDGTYYLDEAGIMQTGWLELEDGPRYLDENGRLYSGWLEWEGDRVYFREDGTLHTGWLEDGGKTYYLNENGNPVRGMKVIDEKTYFFTSTGANILMVNRWFRVPDGYETELKELPNGRLIAAECYDALMKMMADCEAAGYNPDIIGANRTMGDQRYLFNTTLQEWKDKGYADAYARTLLQVAVPGTSEHQLGLAVDILDKNTRGRKCLDWFHEHCWEYGFIVRYPEEKTDITGIMYEPWHYRYVGTELAMELKELGICLEEYLDLLTGDGSTCGNPNYVPPEEETTEPTE